MSDYISDKTVNDLIHFLEGSPSCFHAVRSMTEELAGNGFSELKENRKWQLRPGGKYYVTRNSSSLIAFAIPENGIKGFRIIASHSDSPSFKIKENPELVSEEQYVRLNVEGYGGMLCAPWLDRPLSVAGRIIVKNRSQEAPLSSCDLPSRDASSRDLSSRDLPSGSLPVCEKLVCIDRDLLLIPSLAIHMNREANSGYKYNPQKDMLPLYGNITAKDTFLTAVADAAGVEKEDILGHDLFLYNRQPASVWGASGEFISAPRLDDLQCAFASLQGFLSGRKQEYLALHCVFDNEETGSSTKQGAASTFMYDTLTRIHEALGYSREDYLIHLADSFMLSADNAHAVHPSHTDKSDPSNRPYLNGGIVLKFNANQKYCTDGVSAAMFRELCSRAEVPVQTFANRSDMAGGSTLGNISNTRVALKTADIGLPQLAMHSPYETAGVKDTEYLIRAAKEFFS